MSYFKIVLFIIIPCTFFLVEKIFDNDRPNNFFEESDLNMDEIEGLAFNNRVEESKRLVNVKGISMFLFIFFMYKLPK